MGRRLAYLSACAGIGTAALLTATGAAGAGTAPASTPRPAASPGCTLHVLGETRSSPAETAAWQSVFAAFKARYGCSVTATWEGQFPGIPQLLSEARLAGQPVDLVADGTYNFNLAASGDLMDLTKLVAPYTHDYLPGTLGPFTVDGRVWAVPDEPETSSVFYYDATLFGQLHLSVPRTYAQLVADARAIATKTKVTPLVEGGKDAWEWPMWYMAAFAQTTGNRSVEQTDAFLTGKAQFTSPASLQALQALAGFAKDGLLNETALGTDENGAIAAFVQGKAAMFYDGTWSLPTVRSADPKFKVGVFTFPLVVSRSGVVSQPNGSPNEGMAIPSFIPKGDLKMADQFLEFMSTPAEANKIQATLDPVVPTVRGVAAASDPLSSTLRSYLGRTNGWLDWLWPTDVVTSVENAIEGVMFTHQSAQQAAATVQSELQTLRQQQSYTYDFWSRWSSAKRASVEPGSLPHIQVQG